MYRAGGAGKHGHKDRHGGLIDPLSLIDFSRGPTATATTRTRGAPDASPHPGDASGCSMDYAAVGVPGGGSGAAAASAAAGASVPLSVSGDSSSAFFTPPRTTGGKSVA